MSELMSLNKRKKKKTSESLSIHEMNFLDMNKIWPVLKQLFFFCNFLKDFLMWTTFKVFTKLVPMGLLF